jgi:signal transduction histidine kinase
VIELARLVPPDELAELVGAVARAVDAEVALYDARDVLLVGAAAADAPRHAVHKDGEPLAVIATGSARAASLCETILELVAHHAQARVYAADTHEAAMQVTFGELTERNARLERAVARLEELDRLKSNFLATMSHELRTPLTSVIGYAEMMSEGLAGPISDEQREYLGTILGKADQLLGLITALLDVSTLENGPLSLERTQLSLADVVATEVASFMPQAGRRGIAIQLDASPDAIVLADRRKIRQVVASLLSNAVKFTPDRGRIAVAVRPEGEEILLVVADSGIGISREQAAKIFEPFFQVDSSSTRAFGGAGIGLTLAKAYVEAHGGHIWVETAPGQGATFTAAFPVGGRLRRPSEGV